MSDLVIVAPGKSVLAAEPGEMPRALKPRTVLQAGRFGLTQQDIDEYLRGGTAIRVAHGEEVDERALRLQPTSPPVPSEIDLDKTRREMRERTTGTSPSERLLPPPEPRTGAVPGRTPGKWSYDPASLRGKSLIELNALVMGIDSFLAPFPTIEEAVAQLSSDFSRDDLSKNEPEARVS